MNITCDLQFDDDDDNANAWLKRGNRIKFVMIKDPELRVHLFTLATHASIAQQLIQRDNSTSADMPEFVGAGHFIKNLHPKWQSDSCCETFGYDKPEANADQVLTALEAELQKLFSTDPE